jgi:hypothetical protein
MPISRRNKWAFHSHDLVRLKGKKGHISGHENEFGGLHLAMHRELIATIACFIKLYPRLSFLATPGYP